MRQSGSLAQGSPQGPTAGRHRPPSLSLSGRRSRRARSHCRTGRVALPPPTTPRPSATTRALAWRPIPSPRPGRCRRRPALPSAPLPPPCTQLPSTWQAWALTPSWQSPPHKSKSEVERGVLGLGGGVICPCRLFRGGHVSVAIPPWSGKQNRFLPRPACLPAKVWRQRGGRRRLVHGQCRRVCETAAAGRTDDVAPRCLPPPPPPAALSAAPVCSCCFRVCPCLPPPAAPVCSCCRT